MCLVKQLSLEYLSVLLNGSTISEIICQIIKTAVNWYELVKLFIFVRKHLVNEMEPLETCDLLGLDNKLIKRILVLYKYLQNNNYKSLQYC